MDQISRELFRRAQAGDLLAYPPLASHYARAGHRREAYVIAWWAAHNGVNCGNQFSEIEAQLAEVQRGALERIADSCLVAFKGKGDKIWELKWKWTRVDRLPRNHPPILALLGAPQPRSIASVAGSGGGDEDAFLCRNSRRRLASSRLSEVAGSLACSGSVRRARLTQIRCEVVEGLMPSERVVKIRLADGGIEEVAVSGTLIQGDYLRAAELARREGRVLVELPTESASGNWRVWVPQDAVR